MTNPAVSSITEDSKQWVGELPTRYAGNWLDYALLLVIDQERMKGESEFPIHGPLPMKII